MEQDFKLSKYCHLYESDAAVIFYHSLTFEALKIKYPFAENLKITGKKIIGHQESPIINVLKEKGMITVSDAADDALLNECRKEIRKPYISTAYFFITQNCNLACTYCFERQSETENSKSVNMSCDTADAAIRFFSRLAKLDMQRFNEKKTVIFYGGEPFFNKKTLYHAIAGIEQAVAEGALPANTKMIIVTNGTLLNNADIQFVKEHNITLTFSLDGDSEASSNRLFPDMKTSSWEKATATYKKCRDAGIDLNVACTLTPQTLDRKREILDYFINDVQIKNIGFNAILDNDIIRLDAQYDERAADFVVSSYDALTRAGITENRTRRRIQVFGARRLCLFDCNAAGGRQIAIAPTGEVGICHEHIMDKKHFITNVHEEFDPQQSSVYSEWQRRSPLYMDECQECQAIGVCGGGCVINVERKFDTIWKPDERFCKQTLSIFNQILLPSLQ